MKTAGRPTAQAVEESLQKGFPWPILDECPASTHNTLRAASGRGNGARRRPQCVCPQALILLDKENARSRSRRPKTRTPLRSQRIALRLWPDLSGGACRTQAGREIFDAVREPSSERSNNARMTAQWMCEKRCPVLDACRGILAVEYPAGSWGSVVAGLNADQRRRASGGTDE